MYYNTCNKCGSNLDPGERCDCEAVKREAQTKREALIVQKGKSGQLSLNLPYSNSEQRAV